MICKRHYDAAELAGCQYSPWQPLTVSGSPHLLRPVELSLAAVEPRLQLPARALLAPLGNLEGVRHFVIVLDREREAGDEIARWMLLVHVGAAGRQWWRTRGVAGLTRLGD